jgi:hypothetical protein
LEADKPYGEPFQEDNKRGWKSETYIDPKGRKVVVATHPSRADWTKKETDPTHLVVKALGL